MSGFHEIERPYDDQTITDRFRIKKFIGSKTDGEGNVYDWYEIDQHYRYTDKTVKAKADLQAQIDYIAMMTDVDIEPEE